MVKGSHHSAKSKQKTSESQKGKIPWNKGIPASAESKRKSSETNKGQTRSEKTKKKCSDAKKGENNGMYGKHHSKETKRKIRITTTKNIKENGGGINFNKKSIPFFENFDKENNTKGFYGENEYHIKGTRYRVDYFNSDLKLIIEWDEEFHFKNNQLREKDIQRQAKIQAFYPDFEFKRIRESTYKGIN